jgi:hypothetical protein
MDFASFIKIVSSALFIQPYTHNIIQMPGTSIEQIKIRVRNEVIMAAKMKRTVDYTTLKLVAGEIGATHICPAGSERWYEVHTLIPWLLLKLF